MARFQPKLTLLLVLISLVWLVGCQSQPQNPTQVPLPNEQKFAIPEGGLTPVEPDDLRVAMGHPNEETYTNAQGEQKTGLTTDIRLAFKGEDDTQAEQRRVYEGQALEFHGYHIRVISIHDDDEMVVLGVVPPK